MNAFCNLNRSFSRFQYSTAVVSRGFCQHLFAIARDLKRKRFVADLAFGIQIYLKFNSVLRCSLYLQEIFVNGLEIAEVDICQAV